MVTPAADTPNTPARRALRARPRRPGWPLPRELDHRIANSLQLAADFLLLQQVRLRDPFARSALIDAAERLVAVGHLHRFLSAHEGRELVELAPFLEELAAIISQSTGLRCTAEIEPVWIPAGLAQQLGLAVNELAINAAKHAYERGEAGDLLVHATRDPAGLWLTVSDCGSGLSAGFDLDRTEGLGLVIVRAIAREIHARFLAENDNGARFTLVVPLQESPPRENRSFRPDASR